MERNLSDKLFSNLYENKIIYHNKVTLLCTLLNYDYVDSILKVEFKVDEPILRIKPYLKHFYENLKQKEKVQVAVKSPIASVKGESSSSYNRIYDDGQRLVSFGSFTIWTGFDLVKTVSELKIENKEQEIFETLWE